MQLGLVLIAPAMTPVFGYFAENDYEGALRIWYTIVSLWFVCHEFALQRRQWQARRQPKKTYPAAIPAGEDDVLDVENPLAKATALPRAVLLGRTPSEEVANFDARHGARRRARRTGAGARCRGGYATWCAQGCLKCSQPSLATSGCWRRARCGGCWR